MDEETFHSLRLLVVELVTNSVKYSGTSPGGTIDISVEVDPDKVHAEVTDGGAPFDPAVRSHDPLAPSGRGLLLVDRLSDRWGPGEDETNTVWFEFDSS